MPFDFSRLVDEVFLLERWEPRPRNPGHYRASEYLHCPRRIYYSFQENLPITDLASLRRMRAGQVTESEMVRITLSRLVSENLALEVVGMQQGLTYREGGFEIRGRDDEAVRVRDGEDLTEILIEYKSTSGLEWQIERGFLPREGNVGQLQLYLNMAGVDVGELIYVDRSSYDTAAFRVTRSDEDFEEIVSWYRHLHKDISHGRVPELDSIPICESCQYRKRCEG